MPFVNLVRSALFALFLPLGVGSVSAALIDRGGGLIYDNVLNVTWLQDANYAFTSGYNTIDFGSMTWADANAWAANLSYHDSVRNVSYTGWRLPGVGPISGSSFVYPGSSDGSADYGFNVSAPGTAYAGGTGSELAYMYYNNLGNLAYVDASGAPQADYGLLNAGPFINSDAAFWSGTEYAPNTGLAWTFTTYGVLSGFQDYYPKTNTFRAWAVHDGDIATAVPEPGMVSLLILSLAGLGFGRRRNRKDA